MVREFVKWDNELRAGEQIVDQVDRALAIAQAEPKGPTYLSLPREVLAERLPDEFQLRADPPAIPTPPHPDPAAIEQLAELVAAAEHPLVIASGGDRELFDILGPLAERFAVPVAQYWRTSCAIATNHPYYAGEVPKPELARADVVIVSSSMVPWMPDRMPLRDGATVVGVGPDPLFSGIPTRSFPADLVITATPATAFGALDAALDRLGAADAPTTVARRRSLPAELRSRRDRERGDGREPGGTPMTPEHMSRVIGEAIGPDAIVVNELGLAPAVMDFTRWDSYFGPPISGGLGWGVPTALGLALGHRKEQTGRQVVAVVGDGSYVFANPAACHHCAASLGLGLLTIVADNRVWNAVRRSTIAVYPEGRAAATPTMPLSSLDPAPDYPKLVEAYGGHGEHVADPEQLKGALDRALEVTASGRQALVSIHCSYPDFAHH
jgi:acetolactate synthase-1/2/3 large subunit